MSRAARRLRALVTVAATLALSFAGGSPALAADESGVELVGREGAEDVPYRWTLTDGAGREVAKAERRWGTLAVAPGEYELTIQPQGYEAVAIRWGKVVVPVGGKARVETRSGIELAGRNPAEESPYSWDVVDKATGKRVAHARGRWGHTPLPPGEYSVLLLPRGYEAVEVSWATVTVDAGQAAKVDVRSGIELAGRSPTEESPYSWDIVDKATGKRVAHTRDRWGYTPLPPGEYTVRLLPRGYEAEMVDWSDVSVRAGHVTQIEVRSGIELVGRSESDPSLKSWDVVDPATGKRLAHTVRRWGFTPMPPGEYSVRLLPIDYEAVPVPWGNVTVTTGQIARVEVRSGIELVGRTENDETLQHWEVIDPVTGARVARGYQRWGFTPLRPGAYSVRILPRGYEALPIRWAEVVVLDGGVASLKVASGVALVGRPGEAPPEQWFVFDAARRPIASVHRRWGFTPLPPATYVVVRAPLRWPGVDVKPGEVVTLEEPDLATRWARVSGSGRKQERELDPEGHRKLQEDVEKAVRRAAMWLKGQTALTSMDPAGGYQQPTIGILALVHAGELDRDRELARRCRDYLLRRPLNTSNGTYATSLTAMALRDMAAIRHRSRIFECATWLVENQGWGEGRKVWGYGDAVPGLGTAKPVASAGPARAAGRPMDVVRRGVVAAPRDAWDNSNVQFAVLGLHAAAQSRIGIPKESWARVERHFREVHGSDGGWGYGSSGSTGSMTCAGVASLVVARHHLKVEQPAFDPVVVSGMEWLDWMFTVDENPGSDSDHHYYLYGLERVGVLAGTEFLGDHEWYPVGARYLLREQKADGSWRSTKSASTGDPGDYLDTCYAILFLRRATLPLESELPALVSVAYDEGTLPKDLSPAVELILDSSGSMKELVDGKQKLDIARAVVTEVLDGLASDIHVGLRLYGHLHVWVNRRDDPKAAPLDPSDPRVKSDTQLVVPIGPLDAAQRARIRKWIDSARPLGWTPMVHSLLQAKNDFPPHGKAPRTVVLVSDGEETGGGKIEDVATAYRGAGIDVKIHVVGFDIAGTAAQRQLEELARAGKGRYYGARSAGELSTALRSAVQGLAFEVHDESGQTLVARGSVNGDPVELKPGRYRVRLAGVEAPAAAVTVTEAQEVTLKPGANGALQPAGP